MNPETLLTVSKVVLYVGTALVAIGTIGSSYYSSIVDRAKAAKIDELLDGNRRLQEGNADLLGEVRTYQADSKSKQREIDTLKEEAVKARRGVVSLWDFNGAKREGSAGNMSVTAGPEVAVYQEMGQLEREGKHQQVVDLATQQIQKTPDWLTPYFARAVAYAKLGQTDKAISDLEHVVKFSGGDKAYARAADMLQRMRGKN
jgi:hypothetical protein